MGIQIQFMLPEGATVTRHDEEDAFGPFTYYEASHPEWKATFKAFKEGDSYEVVADANHWGQTRLWLIPWLRENNIKFTEA